MNVNKQYGGTIDFWCIHDLSEMLSEGEIDIPTLRIMTGRSVDEPLGRWRAGSYMRSSMIVNLDLENMEVETENTIYKLQGPGRFSKSNPFNYAFAVDRTFILLSPTASGASEELGDDELFYPTTH